MTHSALPSPTPIVRVRDFAASLLWYREVMDCELLQLVPHTVAMLRCAGMPLQLWQQTGVPSARPTRMVLEPGSGRIFQVHARLTPFMRHQGGATPVLKPWGAWEFFLTDPDGNHLLFVEWTAYAARRLHTDNKGSNTPSTEP